MTDDPFAFHVDQLTRRHRGRHTSAAVAEVTLQRWLTWRGRHDDPFDPALFDDVDAVLTRMPATIVEGQVAALSPLDARPGLPRRAPRGCDRAGPSSTGR